MKRRGSALASVLIASSLLLGLGTVVSATVINTTKLNQRYSENIDLELAAKSALNYGIDYLKKNYKDIGEGKDLTDIPVEYDDINEMTSIYINTDGSFTVTGIAILDRNSEVKAEESTVIKIGDDGEITQEPETPGEPEIPPTDTSNPSEDEENSFSKIKPINFVNATKDVVLGWSSIENKNYIAYGGKLTHDSGYQGLDSAEELKNKKISFNSTNFNLLLKEYEREEYNNFKMTESYLEIKGEEVKSDTFKELKDNNVVVNGKVDLNSGYDNNWKIDGKILIINGDLISTTKVTLEVVNGGKVIVNGNIDIYNSLDIKLENNSLIEVNGNEVNGQKVGGKIRVSSKTNIEMDKSTFFVYNDFETSDEINFDIKDSKIDVLGKVKTSAVIEVNINENSRFDIGNDFESGTRFDLNIDNSIINIYGNIVCPGLLSGDIKNNSKLVIRDSISASGTGYSFNLDNSLLIASDLTAPGGSSFTLKDSVIVSDYIKSSSLITINLERSSLIVKKDFDVNGITTNLKNSVIVSVNLFKSLWNSTITNNYKSYILSGGNFEVGAGTIISGSEDITPDSKIVIDSIKYFIEVN